MQLNFTPVIESLPFLLQGVGMTLFVTVVSMALALLWGLALALLRRVKLIPVRTLTKIYIDFFRGVPLLVLLLWMYFGVGVFLGLDLSPLQAAIATLVIQGAANLAEIYRAGIEAIPKGQVEAAKALGLTRFQSFIDVVFPQALPIIVPAIGNDFIGMVKGSALVSVLGVVELTRAAQMRANFFLRPFEFLTVTAVIYVILALSWGQVFTLLESRFRWVQRAKARS
ncbi:MAG: amino acid ABC transporter [Chloroflexota bacterium]|nr:MAG: amino acid ABC transporter [Chloroflexota bacterium]